MKVANGFPPYFRFVNTSVMKNLGLFILPTGLPDSAYLLPT